MKNANPRWRAIVSQEDNPDRFLILAGNAE